MKYQQGNYILTEFGELPIKHIVFDQYQVAGIDGRILWANDPKPIELIEEWLIKSGCEKKGLCYINDRFKLFWKSDYNFWYVFDNESAIYLTKVEFVHEWQNFYFVMNGEELTIKE